MMDQPLALRPPQELDPVQHLLLKSRSQALHRREALVTARLFELFNARDAELPMKLNNLVGRKAWNTRYREQAGGSSARIASSFVVVPC